MTSARTGTALAATGPSDIGALARLVETAVLAVPGVLALHGGAFGEVATFLPGRRIAGVRLDGPTGRHTVHVVATTTAPVRSTAAAVRAALTTVLPGPVDVVVGDVRTPAEQARLELSGTDEEPADAADLTSR